MPDAAGIPAPTVNSQSNTGSNVAPIANTVEVLSDSLTGPVTAAQLNTEISQPVRGSAPAGKRRKFFNLSTPKAHFLPDYANQIERYGTTDCSSTKLVSSRISIPT